MMTVVFPDLLVVCRLFLQPCRKLAMTLVPSACRHGIIGAGGHVQTMQISDSNPQQAAQILMRAPRHMWLLSVALIVLYFAVQEAGGVLPLPVPLLLISVALSGALAGLLSGAISGLLTSAFIVYWWWIGIGPVPLTGTLARALIACAVTMGLGLFLGWMRDQLVLNYSELQSKREELALFGEELAVRVRRQTQELEDTQEELREQQRRLKSVTKRWIDTQETERRNLARDLHDDIGQILTALRINLDSGRRASDPESPAARLLSKSTSLVDSAIDSIRQLSFSLRPSLLDDLGLSAAIRENSSRLLKNAGIDLELSFEGDDKSVDSETGITAFRISQEAIANVLKHAEAHHVEIHVTTGEDLLCVDISDDGKGFEVEAYRNLSEHFGIASMRERAALTGGKTTVESEPGVGTTVRVYLPLDKGRSLA